jgi:predicted DNA-binding protein with PD1-like motif
MKSTLLHESDGRRTFMVVLSTGEDAVERVTAFAREQRLHASHFTAIGAFSSAVVGYFDWEKKDYRRIPIAEQVEVLSLIGDISVGPDGPKVHAHVVLGKQDASACGGHLLEGRVRPTLEIVLTEAPTHLRRRYDPESGLALIDPTR